MEIETAKRRHTLLALVIASAAFGAHAAAPELVHAKDYGFNASNSTAAIQAAIDSGAKVVVIDAMPTPWYIDQIKLARMVFNKLIYRRNSNFRSFIQRIAVYSCGNGRESNFADLMVNRHLQ